MHERRNGKLKIVNYRILERSLGRCNNVVKAAMDRYWKSKQRQDWHFYKTTVLEQLKDFDGSSKVLHKLLNDNSKFKCME